MSSGKSCVKCARVCAYVCVPCICMRVMQADQIRAESERNLTRGRLIVTVEM